MTDVEFEQNLTELRNIEFREDYERALYDLCLTCTVDQCKTLRGLMSDRKLWHSKPWRNPTDYFRTDLSWDDQLKRGLAQWCIMDGGSPDFRDDLRGLAKHYHSLLVSGSDPDTLFRDVASRCEPRVAKLILGFIDRRPEDKSMEAFHLHVEQTPEGPRVRHRG